MSSRKLFKRDQLPVTTKIWGTLYTLQEHAAWKGLDGRILEDAASRGPALA